MSYYDFLTVWMNYLVSVDKQTAVNEVRAYLDGHLNGWLGRRGEHTDAFLAHPIAGDIMLRTHGPMPPDSASVYTQLHLVL